VEEGNGGNKIAMGNGGGNAMDSGTAVQLQSVAPQSPWTVAMGDGGQMLTQMESMMAAQLQWTTAATVQWTAGQQQWALALALRGDETTSQTRWSLNERQCDNHLAHWELVVLQGVMQ
jgi:hypothetical protein